MDATLERIWGLAGNGESIELAVRPHLVETLLEVTEDLDRPQGVEWQEVLEERFDVVLAEPH